MDGENNTLSNTPANIEAADDPNQVPEDNPQVATDPISVIPLGAARDKDGDWSLVVPNATALGAAVKRLKHLKDTGEIQLSDDHIDMLTKAAVDPKSLASIQLTRQRVDFGWFSILEVRLFTPGVDVSLANDRWVADAIYAADPANKGTPGSHMTAVPMPESHSSLAALIYDSDVSILVSAAEANYRKVLEDNRQDVGRRLIEQPVTLTPTMINGHGAGVTKSAWTTADGNCRVSSGFERLEILPEWLPAALVSKEPYSTMVPGTPFTITPTVLMNMTPAEKRALTRKIAKRSEDRLKQPAKAEGDRGYAADLNQRNAAAAALNALTVPAKLIVGWNDDERPKVGMSRFATAVRSLLVQLNVEGKPLDAAARDGISAEEIVSDLRTAGLIDDDHFDILIGRSDITDAMTRLGLDPNLADLRAALVTQVLTRGDGSTRKVLGARLRPDRSLFPQHRDPAVVELALRSYSSSLGKDAKQIRTAMEAGCVWGALVNRPWPVYNVDTNKEVDKLAARAKKQLSGGPAQRLLGVLGLFALITTGNLLAPGGSAKDFVEGAQIARGRPALIVEALCKYSWGIDLLADAIKRSRAGKKTLRFIDPTTKKLINAPSEWNGAAYNAHLRLAVHQGALPVVNIPGSQTERAAWTKFAGSVVTAMADLETYRDERTANATVDRLPWVEVEATVDLLRRMAGWVPTIADPEPGGGDL